jgi:putative flippase GtrA
VNKLSRTCLLFWDRRLIRFLLVGVTNAVVSYLTFLLAYHILFVGDVLFSQPLSYGAGIAWSYFWNRKWTFQSSAGFGREFVRFVVLQVVLLLLSTGLIRLVVVYCNMNVNIDWILVMTFVTALNFVLTKMYVF